MSRVALTPECQISHMDEYRLSSIESCFETARNNVVTSANLTRFHRQRPLELLQLRDVRDASPDAPVHARHAVAAQVEFEKANFETRFSLHRLKRWVTGQFRRYGSAGFNWYSPRHAVLDDRREGQPLEQVVEARPRLDVAVTS